MYSCHKLPLGGRIGLGIGKTGNFSRWRRSSSGGDKVSAAVAAREAFANDLGGLADVGGAFGTAKVGCVAREEVVRRRRGGGIGGSGGVGGVCGIVRVCAGLAPLEGDGWEKVDGEDRGRGPHEHDCFGKIFRGGPVESSMGVARASEHAVWCTSSGGYETLSYFFGW